VSAFGTARGDASTAEALIVEVANGATGTLIRVIVSGGFKETRLPNGLSAAFDTQADPFVVSSRDLDAGAVIRAIGVTSST